MKGHNVMASKFKTAIALFKQQITVVPTGTDKRPLVAWTEYQTKHNTIEELQEWFNNKKHNMAIVTGVNSGICVLDIDTAEAEQELKKLVTEEEWAYIPMVQTPRGGKHLYFLCSDSKLQSKASFNIPGIDIRANGGVIVGPGSITENGSYELIQGDIDKELMFDISTLVNYKSIMSSKNPQVSSNVVNCPQVSSSFFSNGKRDEDVFHLANCLVKAKADQDFIIETLKRVATTCDYPAKDVFLKLKSALDRANRTSRNLAEEVRDIILSSSGSILSSDVFSCLQVSSREEKKNVSQILIRLCQDGVLQKDTSRHGKYYIPDTELHELNILDADDSKIDLWLPLGLHKLVDIQKKNIIIISGVTNTGKTSFLLNIARQNMLYHKINYFSSEMGGSEAKRRLKQFKDVELKDWVRHCKFYDRASNFADVIRPNDINLIDYLEDTGDAYMTKGRIKEIFDKLQDGIAVIALQKKPNTDYAVGGHGTAEKARLYLSLENMECTVTKAKNITEGAKNVNGLKLKYEFQQSGLIMPAEGASWKTKDNFTHFFPSLMSCFGRQTERLLENEN